MTTAICPTVWEVGLPSIAYDHLYDPDEAHRVIADARRQGRWEWDRMGRSY
jgi:hypothetical protein